MQHSYKVLLNVQLVTVTENQQTHEWIKKTAFKEHRTHRIVFNLKPRPDGQSLMGDGGGDGWSGCWFWGDGCWMGVGAADWRQTDAYSTADKCWGRGLKDLISVCSFRALIPSPTSATSSGENVHHSNYTHRVILVSVVAACQTHLLVVKSPHPLGFESGFVVLSSPFKSVTALNRCTYDLTI